MCVCVCVCVCVCLCVLYILKIYKTLLLLTFLYGSENWTLTASQRRRTEAAEKKLLRPLAGYTLYEHKTNDYIWRELKITGILDKIDEYRRNWFQHLQRMPQKVTLVKVLIRISVIGKRNIRHASKTKMYETLNLWILKSRTLRDTYCWRVPQML
jgi:hypothetical protein